VSGISSSGASGTTPTPGQLRLLSLCSLSRPLRAGSEAELQLRLAPRRHRCCCLRLTTQRTSQASSSSAGSPPPVSRREHQRC
jgi:hypothetical protein